MISCYPCHDSTKHSWIHFGMDLGHGFGMVVAWIWGMTHGLESSQSCMDFGGIVRGGFWQDFEGNAWNKFDGNSGKILG